jgi:hypothetical protein
VPAMSPKTRNCVSSSSAGQDRAPDACLDLPDAGAQVASSIQSPQSPSSARGRFALSPSQEQTREITGSFTCRVVHVGTWIAAKIVRPTGVDVSSVVLDMTSFATYIDTADGSGPHHIGSRPGRRMPGPDRAAPHRAAAWSARIGSAVASVDDEVSGSGQNTLKP